MAGRQRQSRCAVALTAPTKRQHHRGDDMNEEDQIIDATGRVAFTGDQPHPYRTNTRFRKVDGKWEPIEEIKTRNATKTLPTSEGRAAGTLPLYRAPRSLTDRLRKRLSVHRPARIRMRLAFSLRGFGIFWSSAHGRITSRRVAALFSARSRRTAQSYTQVRGRSRTFFRHGEHLGQKRRSASTTPYGEA